MDDLASATLNYAARRCRAELRPLTLRVFPQARAEPSVALVDITPFSSWAIADQPARAVFDPDGFLGELHMRLRYGTSVHVRFGRTAMAARAQGLLPASNDVEAP